MVTRDPPETATPPARHRHPRAPRAVPVRRPGTRPHEPRAPHEWPGRPVPVRRPMEADHPWRPIEAAVPVRRPITRTDPWPPADGCPMTARSYSADQAAAVRELADEGRSVRAIAAALGLSRSAVSRILTAAGGSPAGTHRTAEAPPPYNPVRGPGGIEFRPTVPPPSSAPAGPAPAPAHPDTPEPPAVTTGPRTVRVGGEILTVDAAGRVECPRCRRRVSPAEAVEHVRGAPSGVLRPIPDPDPWAAAPAASPEWRAIVAGRW